MDQALLQRVLQGDQEAIALFGESDHCAVIDWRCGLPEIVEALGDFLPPDHLRVENQGEAGSLLVVRGKAPRSVPLSARQEELLVSINGALMPEFELRQFRPMDGDGYSIFVAPSALWSELERSNPRATDRFFLTAERLAAYWKKGYLARLFSKP